MNYKGTIKIFEQQEWQWMVMDAIKYCSQHGDTPTISNIEKYLPPRVRPGFYHCSDRERPKHERKIREALKWIDFEFGDGKNLSEKDWADIKRKIAAGTLILKDAPNAPDPDEIFGDDDEEEEGSESTWY